MDRIAERTGIYERVYKPTKLDPVKVLEVMGAGWRRAFRAPWPYGFESERDEKGHQTELLISELVASIEAHGDVMDQKVTLGGLSEIIFRTNGEVSWLTFKSTDGSYLRIHRLGEIGFLVDLECDHAKSRYLFRNPKAPEGC